jgi:hypothetical protein
MPDIPNWTTLLIELAFAAGITYWLYRLQRKTEKLRDELLNEIQTVTKRTDSVTQQKATAERENKRFQCQRIIKSLHDIQEEEQSLKTHLTGYNVEEPTNEIKLFEIKLFGYSFENRANNSINIMYDAIGQLQVSLNDNPLRNDLLGYLRRFYVLPDRILKHNFPEQKHQREHLLSEIDEQTQKIEHFIERFKKEMDFS